MHRDDLDKIAWQTIHSAIPVSGEPAGLTATNRPCNYKELGERFGREDDFELAWSEFLHEFYRYRTASFFAEPPPKVFSPGFRALLAGAAEFLCTEFHLETPTWVHEPEYTMPELFEPFAWLHVGEDEDQHQARIARAHPLFMKHNVVWESRNLISL